MLSSPVIYASARIWDRNVDSRSMHALIPSGRVSPSCALKQRVNRLSLVPRTDAGQLTAG